MNFYMQAYLSLKEHIAKGCHPDVWLVQKKEYANQTIQTQYRETASITEFLEWLKNRAVEEDRGLEFSSSIRPIIGGSISEGRL